MSLLVHANVHTKENSNANYYTGNYDLDNGDEKMIVFTGRNITSIELMIKAALSRGQLPCLCNNMML